MANRFLKHKQIIKYLVAGGTAAAVDLALLYLLTDKLGLWYLFSACLAFAVAFFVSFFLQKFWTFRDADKEMIFKQMGAYLAVAVANLGINAGLMYLSVDYLRIWYMLAQVIVSGLIAIESYFIYKFLIFNKIAKRPEARLKILIVSGIYPPDIGGPAQYAKNLFERFSADGHNVQVISYRLEKKLPIFLRHFLFFCRVLYRLPGTDLIIALDTLSVGFPSVLAAKIFGKKIIIRTGGDFLWESFVARSGQAITLKNFYAESPALSLKEKIIFSLTKFALGNASAVVFSTSWQKAIFEEYYGLEARKNHVIENYFLPASVGGLAASEKNFLWAGRPIKLKNVDKLKSAFSGAKKIRPELRLEIIQDMPYEKLLEKMRSAYALILPSLSEVSPNFILDGLSLGKPFVLTEESGYKEKLEPFGVFVDPFDETDIKNKILFLADEENYRRYAEKIKTFDCRHSWKEIAEEFTRLYETL